MKLQFKTETKPGIWHVTLSHGAYSDYSERHLFFRANDRAEAKEMLVQFCRNEVENDDSFAEWNSYGLIIYGPEGEDTDPENVLLRLGKNEDEEDVRWDDSYGDCRRVDMEMLPLIYARGDNA